MTSDKKTVQCKAGAEICVGDMLTYRLRADGLRVYPHKDRTLVGSVDSLMDDRPRKRFDGYVLGEALSSCVEGELCDVLLDDYFLRVWVEYQSRKYS